MYGYNGMAQSKSHALEVFEGLGSLPSSSTPLFLQVIKRFTLQRLRSAELLEFWLDVSHLGVGSEQHAQHAAVATFQRLRNLLMAVMNLEVWRFS